LQVKLINKSPKILETLYTAGHSCYSTREPSDIFENGPVITQKEQDAIWVVSNSPQEFLINLEDKKQEKMIKTVRGIIARNHNTVMRHVTFTFSISGVSRVTMAQISRHSAGIDFDIQSQRYVTYEKDFEWVLPYSLKNIKDDNLSKKVEKFLSDAKEIYFELVDSKEAHKEDARYLLPQAAPTNITCTCNLAAFLHLHNLRAKDTTGKAQDEVKQVVKLMAEELVKAEPWLAEFIKL
jgi:thymidylate synthase (FAD)